MTEKEKAELFRQYEPLMKSLAYKAAARRMVVYALDDLIGEASVAFCRAVNKHDQCKGPFRNYLWSAVANGVNEAIDAIKKNEIDSLDAWSVADGDIMAMDVPVVDPAFDLADMRASMDDDEQAVFDEALTRQHKSRWSIVKKLWADGWTLRRAGKAVASVKQLVAS